MKQRFAGWAQVAANLKSTAQTQEELEVSDPEKCRLNAGQRDSLRGIAKRLTHNGVLVADEVGMGKTRVAVSVAEAVTRAGGRVAILIPPGLGFQWSDELRSGGYRDLPPTLRSLKQYFEPWRHDSALNPWFEEPILAISHVFANWRLADTSAPWRWALLPELYAQSRKSTQHRWPRGYRDWSELADPQVQAAGRSIYEAIPPLSGHPAKRRLGHLSRNTPWPGALHAEEYVRTGRLRPLLEQAVGLGLGSFDLIIIDEAHKSRGHGTGLSRLLRNVVLSSAKARRLSVTATPVELSIDQWHQTLTRLGVDTATVESIGRVVQKYDHAVRRVKHNWPQCNEAAMGAYRTAAKDFQTALSPYVLRRDKREEDAVKVFASLPGETWERYRLDQPVAVDLDDLTPQWRQAICAAESLAVVVRPSQSESPDVSRRAQLMRLTTGNGHGIAAWLDIQSEDDKADPSHDTPAPRSGSPTADSPAAKRDERIDWWSSVITAAFRSDDPCPTPGTTSDNALYGHPAIIAAVGAIEDYTGADRKVLVFGRFNRPMRALVDLLNAREMLRRVTANDPWPSKKMGRRGAAEAAKRQLRSAVNLDKLDAELAGRYDREQRSRAKRREDMRRPLADAAQDATLMSKRERDLLQAFLHAWESDPASALPVLRALEALSPPGTATPAELAQAFIDLMRAVSDHDISRADEEADILEQVEMDDNADGTDEESWEEICQHISDFFDRPEGGFARQMYGKTSQQSRRMMQLAFNRQHSHPRVLVAQSLVGREGLNLHEQCRVVVLLHPEWNPAVVEQQVGRVDRLNSRWEKDLEAWVQERDGDVPRIEIRPIIFKGTYDELNWSVLRDRQDDFRSQLSGIVIPTRRVPDNPDLAHEVARAAPSFLPPN